MRSRALIAGVAIVAVSGIAGIAEAKSTGSMHLKVTLKPYNVYSDLVTYHMYGNASSDQQPVIWADRAYTPSGKILSCQTTFAAMYQKSKPKAIGAFVTNGKFSYTQSQYEGLTHTSRKAYFCAYLVQGSQTAVLDHGHGTTIASASKTLTIP